MLHLGTIPKDAFKPFFGFASVFYKGVELHLETDKMWLRAVDTSNCIMIYSILNIPLESPNVFKIDIDDLAKIAPKQDVIIGYEGNYVVFVIDNETTYKQPLMSDPKIKTANYPEQMVLPVSITMPVEKIGKILELMNLLVSKKESADKARFNIIDGKFTVENSDKTRTYSPTDAVITGDPVAKSLFSPDLLIDAMSHYKHFDTATIHMGTDNPLIIEYTNAHMMVKTLIAPRIENDD